MHKKVKELEDHLYAATLSETPEELFDLLMDALKAIQCMSTKIAPIIYTYISIYEKTGAQSAFIDQIDASQPDVIVEMSDETEESQSQEPFKQF